MPRDYKHHARLKPRRDPLPGWLWLVTGLLLGLLVAWLFHLNGLEPPPRAGKLAQPPKTPASTQPGPGPDTIPPPPEEKFSFYRILPEMEVVVPETEITGKPKKGVPQVEKPGTYVLQAGSFQQAPKAEALKARLALLGFESTVRKVSGTDGQSWYRVRIGPFHDLAALNDARARLRSQGLDTILIKLTEP